MEYTKLVPPKLYIYKGCIYRKQCYKSFIESHTLKELIKLVYSNLIRPIRVPSINKARYVLMFIEHRSQYPKYYFLKSKDTHIVLEYFKEYKI